MEQQLQWDLEADELASDSLLLSLASQPPAVGAKWLTLVRWREWGRLAIRVLAESKRLTALAAAAKVIAGGQAPEDFSISSVLDTVQPRIGDKDEDFKLAEEMGTLPWTQLAYATTTEVLRSVRSSNPTPPVLGPFNGYFEREPEQLSGVAVPITVVGIAALAATAYYLAEHSEDQAVVEVEKAWAMARAYSEIRVAEAQIAAGQKPTLSDWGSARGGYAKVTTAPWFPIAAIGGGLVLLGGAAYLGSKSLEERRANPARARRRQLSMFDEGDPRQGRLDFAAKPSTPARKRRRRKGNPCGTTAKNPGKWLKMNPSREEFVGQAMAGGASRKQAGRLWRGYLAAQRAKAGRRGGKAAGRRRRNPVDGGGPEPTRTLTVSERIQGLPVQLGKPSSAASSAARRSSKPAAKPRKKPSSRRRNVSVPSSSPAKRAPRIASKRASSPAPVASKRPRRTARRAQPRRKGASAAGR